MAFHLRPEESARRGLRSLAKKELASARQDLQQGDTPPKDEAIHDARKSLKKVRAVMD